VKKMKATTIAAIALIVIIVTGIGAYSAYTYSQNNGQNTQPTSTPTPSPSPSSTITPSPSPSASPSPTATSNPTATAAPTASPSPSPTPMPSPTTLKVASTTSLKDTGLEEVPEIFANGTVVRDDLKDAFQAKYPWITVNFLYYGTGPAIQAAQRGDADMILVHSPSQELPFLTGGYGVDRKIVAYNFFVIIGPTSDPAHINGLTNVSQALQNIYNFAQNSSNVLWFSRNDASGTATKEISLWTAAGFNYTQLTAQTSWFKVTGSGMGPTLLAANYYGNIGGYTISDTGTYLAYYNRGDIQLKTQIQAQQSLLNVYSAIIDNPQNTALSSTNFDASLLFVNFLVSDEGQQLIGNYGKIAYGQSLFTPFVPLASGAVSNDTLLGWIKSYAYINSNNQISATGTECPSTFRYNAGNLYSSTYDIIVANFNANMSINAPNYYIADKPKIALAQAVSTSSSSKVNKV
jgi:tungstate transport system substrate-binding protein